MNTRPTATYRLQFRDGMTFDKAAMLVPYWKDLGISHLYASPLFQATAGSTHGYDITDHNAFDAALGGMPGFLRLSAALKAAGLGLIVDIVPNHMAFSLENPWLYDVLTHGQNSAFAYHFDIDWSKGRLVLPFLEKPFDELSREGALKVELSESGYVLRYGEQRFPLSPTTSGLADGISDPEALAAIHAAQAWRLTYWRLERDGLTHRRFFNVTQLIGVRVEEDEVFDDVHRLLLSMVKDDHIQGIRIDHIDGLADPAGYLDKLRERAGDTPVWVEKILSGPERLPDWPIVGTTGYEAGSVITRLLTNPDGLADIDSSYGQFTGVTPPWTDMLRAAKLRIISHELAAERLWLSQALSEIASKDPVACDYGPDTLERAVVEILLAFPVYRTYLAKNKPDEVDSQILDAVTTEAAKHLDDDRPIRFLHNLFSGIDDAAIRRFVVRFQQVSGALIAKAQEDTAFYRFPRLLSACEVGSEPNHAALEPTGFHEEMKERLERQSAGLTLTSSHDTKRSEDARMRIAALSHRPDAFAQLVSAFEHTKGHSDIPPAVRWYLYQSFIGLWGATDDLEGRLVEHMQKALREAKQYTTWTEPDEAFENRVYAFVRTLVSAHANDLPDIWRDILGVADALTLAMTAIKLVMPGIPDIYQGCEIARPTLTDPDNRLAVDFEGLKRILADETMSDALSIRKFQLTQQLLRMRREYPDVFALGSYEPLELPEGMFGFVRTYGDAQIGLICTIRPTDVPSGSRQGLVETMTKTIGLSVAYEVAQLRDECDDAIQTASSLVILTKGITGIATSS